MLGILVNVISNIPPFHIGFVKTTHFNNIINKRNSLACSAQLGSKGKNSKEEKHNLVSKTVFKK